MEAKNPFGIKDKKKGQWNSIWKIVTSFKLQEPI
jgi:hypothetical protein